MTDILAADIGGTSSRFAVFITKENIPIKASDVYTFPTQNRHINTFLDFIEYYHNNKPEQLPCFIDVDTVVLAVPGPVSGHQCPLPNIAWDIDLNDVPYKHIRMLNDFTAQACACLLPDVTADLVPVKTGRETDRGRIAIIGAGTGLGHCCLVPDAGNFIPVPSEAGYAGFAFHGEQEKQFETFLLSRISAPYVVNDMVVCGNGLALLHEFLTGRSLTAEEIFADNDNRETVTLFSRFYARVCRNYCLTNMIDDRLIISGGLAIKHPGTVTSDGFINEFLHCASPAYDSFLADLPIFLNRKESIGLIGAAGYGLASIPGDH